MCMITSTALAVASIAAAVIGAGVGAYSTYQQGRQQQAAYNYQAQQEAHNAEVARQNAATELQGGIEDARLQRMKTLQAIGKQSTAMAANGIDVTSGTPLDVIEDTAAMGELDALNIMAQARRASNNYLIQAGNFANNAALDEIAGKNAYKSGITNSIGTVINGAASTVKGLGDLNKVGVKWQNYGQTLSSWGNGLKNKVSSWRNNIFSGGLDNPYKIG